MEFTLEAAQMQQAQGLMAQVAADLVAERQKLDGSVSGLLGSGWSGVAADEYEQAWGEWREGADRVLKALHQASELMGQTRASYLTSDDDSVRTSAPIGERLQARLS